MIKQLSAAFALSLVLLPLASRAYAQCVAGRPCRTPTTTATATAPADPTPTVCFFTSTNFKGPRFCESGQRSVFTVPAEWRDSIKSITVGDRTEVRICPEFTLKGDCGLIGRDTDELQRGLFDQVYSYAIDKT